MSGLICGEGNFTIAIVKSPNCRLGFHARPIFQVELGIVDEPLVRSIHGFFGFGGVMLPRPRTRVRNESATVRYMATAIQDCAAVARFFEQSPLIGAKQRSFNVWRSCLQIIQDNRHTTTEGFKEIVTLRSSINHFRRPSGFRDVATIHGEAHTSTTARPLVVWSKAELALIGEYVDGQMTRDDLVSRLGRSIPSVANQITRWRKAQKGA